MEYIAFIRNQESNYYLFADMSNVIRAQVFSGRRDPTGSMLNRLVVTGGRQQIKSWLATVKYTGDAPVAVPVFTHSGFPDPTGEGCPLAPPG